MRTIRGSVKGWASLRAKKHKPPKERMKCYQQRDDRLLVMGYSEYKNYLASDAWREIRERRLAKCPQCTLCDAPATQVHHLDYTYETLFGRQDFRLAQLCRACHRTIEFDGERKLTVREATGKLYKLAEETERGRRWIIWTVHRKREKKLVMRRKRRQAKQVK